MNNRFILGAYWKARQETVENCGKRLLAFMKMLNDSNEAFSHWYHRGNSREDALRQTINVKSHQELVALLAAGCRRRDVDNGIIEDLGYHIGMWNGAESEKEVGFSVTCGLFSKAPDMSNCVVLKFSLKSRRVIDSSVPIKLLSAAATSWEPDWAGIFSKDAMNARDWQQKPFVDWMVYVPQHIISVPPPSTVTHLENGGSLIVVQPDAPSVGNLEDLKRIHEIEKLVRPS